MNPDTGDIKPLSDFYYNEPKVPISDAELPRVRKMNRKARRAWAKKQKAKKT